MSRRCGSFSYRSGRLLTVVFSLLALVLMPPLLASASTVEDSAASVPPSAEANLRTDMDWGKMPLYFLANGGRLDQAVSYYVDGKDKTLYFTSEGLTFTFASTSAEIVDAMPREEVSAPKERWTVKLDYLGARDVTPRGKEATEAVVSYFSGAPEDWQTGVPTYYSIVYDELWSGVDLIYSGTTDQLKQEFLLEPGADPAQIRLAYRGADVSLDESGGLLVSTPAGSFVDSAPIACQEIDGQRVPVAVEFAVGEASGSGAEAFTEYGLRLGAYDAALPLVIDPAVLVRCGYIGGNDYDQGHGIALDAAGNAYIAGLTASTHASFPVVTGPDLTYNNGNDVFVAKVNADGTGLVYCGFIGGSNEEVGYGIAVDAAGNAYVTGYTSSTEATFPVTVGPDLTYNGGVTDAFVAKVNSAGTGLVYCGYVGGDGFDYGLGIAVDTAGNACITGYTESTEATFPVTVGPDLTYNSGFDAFAAKVKADGTGFAYSGYIGGIADDTGYGIAVDAAGNAYITGYTYSSQATFPVTVGPDLTYNGVDAFVAKVNSAGTGLVYCGYVGGSGSDYGLGIAVDAAGNAYVTGYTDSSETSFPVTVGPDLTYNSKYDAFAAKVKADGAGLVYCGYVGGSGSDYGLGIAVDAAGSAYVTGYTDSNETTFPVAVGPDLTYNGNTDAFVAKVKADATGLVCCGYVGGSDYDEGLGIALDDAGNALVTGATASTETSFPVCGGLDLTYRGGSRDAFVAKIATGAPARYQQTDGKITYLGDWITSSTWSASGGSFASTSQPGAAAIAKFVGAEVSVVARTTAWYGQANIYIDGTLVDTVDLYSASAAWKVPVYTNDSLSYGEHTVIIECTGSKNSSSAGTAINLDALDILGALDQAPTPTRVDDNDGTCTSYNPAWSRWDASGYWAAYQDTYAFTDQETHRMTVAFEGTHLSWVSRTSNTQGEAKVTLDGNDAEAVVIDLYSASTSWKKRVYSTGILDDGVHYVTIECLGEKNPASWWYTIGVDAFDIMGTPATPPPPAALPTRYQQTDAKITYLGDWTTLSNGSASGLSYASASQKGAAAMAEFTGTEVSVLASKGPAYGEADIYVDDVIVDTVDLYSPSTAWKVPIYSDDTLSDTTHTIAVECTGDKNPGSSGTAVNLDALDITGSLDQADAPTRIDDDNATYATYDPAWSRWDNSGYWAAYLDTYAFTDQATYKVTVTFHGTHLSWVSRTANTQGMAKVTLDGNDAEAVTIDLYSPSTLWKKRVYSTGLLTDDTHTVVIECLGTKNPASWWYSIGVDAFDVMETAP